MPCRDRGVDFMKTFLDGSKPLTAMIQCRTADECIEKIKRSLADGAEALGVQLCQLRRDERTDEKLKTIFEACADKPVYITSYRYNESEGMTDDECAELLLRALDCGATLCDVVGDFFDRNEFQITDDPEASEKQKKLVEAIHEKGGEVLISTHDFRELTAEEIFRVARLQAEHGADVIKIVVKSASEKRLPEYIAVIQKVNEELKKPFLFLDCGASANVLRKVGPMLGTCMYLGVESHNEFDTPAQPVLRKLKQIRDRMEERN